MVRTIVSSLFLALVGCVTPTRSDLYDDQYVVLERVESGYELNGRVYESGAVDALIDDLEDEPTDKVLLGRETEFTMGDLLGLGSQLRQAGFELFLIGTDGSVTRTNFAFD